MNIPQFNAEASLGPTMGVYRGKTGHGRSNSAQVLPSQNLSFGSVMTCCRFVPGLGRVCTSRQTHPLEYCECITTSLGPIIICRNAVNALA